MIRAITRLKPEEELDRLLEGCSRVFIVGCGTCPTLIHTGGEAEVRAMAESLTEKGKVVTGTTVAPVACDNLTPHAIKEETALIAQADALLVMSCAYGVQNIARTLVKMVVPALDTLYIAKEEGHGIWNEVCSQCGTCIIGETGGICPVTACHKSLINGPCGGTDNGKCEIDKNLDCAWTTIYRRLSELKKLDLMKKYQSPRNHNASPTPGKYEI